MKFPGRWGSNYPINSLLKQYSSIDIFRTITQCVIFFHTSRWIWCGFLIWYWQIRRRLSNCSKRFVTTWSDIFLPHNCNINTAKLQWGNSLLYLSSLQGFWYFAEKKAKFHGIFRGKFAEKLADFVGRKSKFAEQSADFAGEKSKSAEKSADFVGF